VQLDRAEKIEMSPSEEFFDEGNKNLDIFPIDIF